MSFIKSCQGYYTELQNKLKQDCFATHQYEIGKYISFKVPSDVEAPKLEVDSVFLNDYLNKDELKQVALKQMKLETRDIELISNDLTEESLTVLKYCIKTGQTIVNGVYKFVCTLNIEDLIKSFGDVISNISVDSIKKIVKFVKSVIKKFFEVKNFDKIKEYIENCKWFKFCKRAFGLIINFIHKLTGKRTTRDLVEVEGIMINVPSKSLAEAYKTVMEELELACC